MTKCEEFEQISMNSAIKRDKVTINSNNCSLDKKGMNRG